MSIQYPVMDMMYTMCYSAEPVFSQVQGADSLYKNLSIHAAAYPLREFIHYPLHKYACEVAV